MSDFITEELQVRLVGKQFNSLAEYTTWLGTSPFIRNQFLAIIKTGANTTIYKLYDADEDQWNDQFEGAVAGSSAPLESGNETAGSSGNYSREDHIHPNDTTFIDLLADTSANGPLIINPFTNVRSNNVASKVFMPAWVLGKRVRLFISNEPGYSIATNLKANDATIREIDGSLITAGQQITLNVGVMYDLVAVKTGFWELYQTSVTLGTNANQALPGNYSYPWSDISGKPATFAPDSHDHNSIYYTETEIDALFEGESGGKKQVHWDRVTNKPASFTPSSHNHDSLYHTESEINNFFEGESAGKKQVSWDRITDKPGAYALRSYVHSVQQNVSANNRWQYIQANTGNINHGTNFVNAIGNGYKLNNGLYKVTIHFRWFRDSTSEYKTILAHRQIVPPQDNGLGTLQGLEVETTEWKTNDIIEDYGTVTLVGHVLAYNNETWISFIGKSDSIVAGNLSIIDPFCKIIIERMSD